MKYLSYPRHLWPSLLTLALGMQISACEQSLLLTGDNDNDGVVNAEDLNDENPNICYDKDQDGCDDCSMGEGPNAANDGTDSDAVMTSADGICDVRDADIDNDTVLNDPDPDDFNASICGNSDGDTCDDCRQSAGGPHPEADGPDHDGDRKCDASDTDDDNDTIADAQDPQPLNNAFCGSWEFPTHDACDDCVRHHGTPSPDDDGPDGDRDRICDASDSNTPVQTHCGGIWVRNRDTESNNTSGVPSNQGDVFSDIYHNYSSEGANFNVATSRDECLVRYNFVKDLYNAGGCLDNATNAWTVASTFEVRASNAAVLESTPWNVSGTCPAGTIASAGKNCIGQRDDCKLANGTHATSFSVDANSAFGQAPDAKDRPLHTYPFVKTVTFRAWNLGGAHEGANLVVKYRAPNGSIFQLVSTEVENNEDAADRTLHTVHLPQWPLAGTFVNGSASIQFSKTGTGTNIVVKDIVLTGREN